MTIVCVIKVNHKQSMFPTQEDIMFSPQTFLQN